MRWIVTTTHMTHSTCYYVVLCTRDASASKYLFVKVGRLEKSKSMLASGLGNLTR